MKDYKRLTERDEFGNADIIGVGSEILASALDFDELNKLTFALNQFAKLEDKIESGELCDRKEVEQIVKERDEYKHRAEVAERALKNVCRNIIEDEEDGIEVAPRDEVLYNAYLWQAEKELQEERKDEQFYL